MSSASFDQHERPYHDPKKKGPDQWSGPFNKTVQTQEISARRLLTGDREPGHFPLGLFPLGSKLRRLSVIGVSAAKVAHFLARQRPIEIDFFRMGRIEHQRTL